jgi:hypothetical protein
MRSTSLGGPFWSSAGDWMARAWSWSVARTAAWGFPVWFGWASRGAQLGEQPDEGTADAAGRQLGSRERPLPGQALVGDEGSGEPELPEREGKQPGPAVGGGGVSGADSRPAERLFEEAGAVLSREAQDVGAPQVAQIRWQLTPDPGQPERAGGVARRGNRSSSTRTIVTGASIAPLGRGSRQASIWTSPHSGSASARRASGVLWVTGAASRKTSNGSTQPVPGAGTATSHSYSQAATTPSCGMPAVVRRP